MEVVKNKSESQNSKKSKNLSDNLEKEEGLIETIKSKKKNKSKKQKVHLNGKENENASKNDNDCLVEESTHNAVENGDKKENGYNTENESNEVNVENNKKENDEFIDVCGEDLEKNENKNHCELLNNDFPQQKAIPNDEFLANFENVENKNLEMNNDNNTTIETESCAKKDISFSESNNVVDSDITENNVDKTFEEANEEIKKDSEPDESASNGINGSDAGSYYEDAHTAEKEQIQYAQNTAKEENFFPNKITSFLGKWSATTEQQNDEISSSKKFLDIQTSDETVFNHPYLSKVSGRCGIRDRLNSSMSSLNSKNEKIETPKNSGHLLDDSFRVRTDPSRINSVEIKENPTLRKFKGKRCLNTNNEPDDDDEENLYLATTKRRKLNDKSQESGLFGSILWTPFKKKPIECENSMKLANSESKLSRFLSPFWFWKKTEGQKEKVSPVRPSALYPYL